MHAMILASSDCSTDVQDPVVTADQVIEEIDEIFQVSMHTFPITHIQQLLADFHTYVYKQFTFSCQLVYTFMLPFSC